jgi:structural maintenance of chromosome 4
LFKTCYFSDDEEEEDSGNQPAQSGDPVVKSEPGEDGASKPKPSSNSSELHIYSEDELRRFRKKEMMADVELLDGALACIVCQSLQIDILK